MIWLLLACVQVAGPRPKGVVDTADPDRARPSVPTTTDPTAPSEPPIRFTGALPTTADPAHPVGPVEVVVATGGVLTADGCVDDPALDALVTEHPRVRLGLHDADDRLSDLSDPTARAAVVASCVAVLTGRGLDGLHLTFGGAPADPRAVTLAARDLRIALDALGAVLAITAADGLEPEVAEDAHVWVVPVADRITPGVADHHASLADIADALAAWPSVPPEQLFLGAPLHGYRWSGLASSEPGAPADDPPTRVTWPEARALREGTGWTADRDAEGAFLSHPDGGWVSFEDEATLAERRALADSLGIGLHWLDLTADDGTLLR